VKRNQNARSRSGSPGLTLALHHKDKSRLIDLEIHFSECNTGNPRDSRPNMSEKPLELTTVCKLITHSLQDNHA
jgi:hypothetical protein